MRVGLVVDSQVQDAFQRLGFGLPGGRRLMPSLAITAAARTAVNTGLRALPWSSRRCIIFNDPIHG